MPIWNCNFLVNFSTAWSGWGVVMRIYITQIVKVCVMNGIKPNYLKTVGPYNWASRTVKRYYLNQQQSKVNQEQ